MRRRFAMPAGFGFLALSVAIALLTGDALRAQEGSGPDAAAPHATAPSDETKPSDTPQPSGGTGDAAASPSGEQPGLGIAVGGGSEQQGAVVMDVQEGSPAAQAGLRPGDRVLSIAGHEVSSPAELSSAVARHKVGEQIEIRVSRDGKEETLSATLAARSLLTQQEKAPALAADDQQASQDDDAGAMRSDAPRRGAPNRQRRAAPPSGWLGVMLQDADARGAEITQIFPNGPAARAGLEEGDRILKIGEEEVGSVEEAVERFGAMKPGQRVKLSVADADGQQRDVTVRLGDRRRAMAEQSRGPDEEFRGMPPTFAPGGEQGGMPFFDGDVMRQHQRRMDEHQQRLEQLTEELLQEVRALRGEVQRLGGGSHPPEAPAAASPANNSESNENEQTQGNSSPGENR